MSASLAVMNIAIDSLAIGHRSGRPSRGASLLPSRLRGRRAGSRARGGHGAADLGASKRFYVEHGLTVKRSFPGRYVEFDAPAGAIKLALYPGRAGLAKDAGVSPEGDERSHGIAVRSAAGRFSDPDGFAWEAA